LRSGQRSGVLPFATRKPAGRPGIWSSGIKKCEKTNLTSSTAPWHTRCTRGQTVRVMLMRKGPFGPRFLLLPSLSLSRRPSAALRYRQVGSLLRNGFPDFFATIKGPGKSGGGKGWPASGPRRTRVAALSPDTCAYSLACNVCLANRSSRVAECAFGDPRRALTIRRRSKLTSGGKIRRRREAGRSSASGDAEIRASWRLHVRSTLKFRFKCATVPL